MKRQQRLWFFLAGVSLVGLLMFRCTAGDATVTATPTKTRVVLAVATNTPIPTSTLQPSPTSTSSPSPSPSSVPASASPPVPTETATPTETQPVPSAIPTRPPPTNTATPPANTSRPSPQLPTATPTARAQSPLPPQQDGEWDMEAGFVPGSSPLGEDCPGWAVAVGWQAFVAPGSPASSCLDENKNVANIRRGERSQELTFDFISAEAGISKRAQTIPGHRYQIEAWGKHVRSQSPVELSLGVDLSGGEDWRATSVIWYPWDETGEDVWVHIRVVVRASGETLAVFLKAYHPLAVQGGATLFDDVSIEDLGQ